MERPYDTYNGSKAGNGVYQNIINFIPPCLMFVDAMVGNGGIVTNLKRPLKTVINDIDKDIISRYKQEDGLIIRNTSYETIIRDYQNIPGVFFYFDPPYLKIERKGGKRDLYKYDWEISQHVDFLTGVVKMKCPVMVSHYQNHFYDEVLLKRGWRVHSFPAATRNGGAIKSIYMNYPNPEFLQDYRYVGHDFIHRQQIKRKVKRWKQRLALMEGKERNAILEALNKKFNGQANY